MQNNSQFKSSILLFLSILFISFSCNSSTDRFSDSEREKIDQEVTQISKSITQDGTLLNQYLKDEDLKKDLKTDLSNFYKNRDYKLAWITLDELEPQAKSLIELIRKSHEHGLDSNNYYITEINNLYSTLYHDSISEESFGKDFVKLDYTFTAAYLTYASHMLGGVINPEIADSNWVQYKKEKEWDLYLQEALENKNVEASITSLIPKNEQYSLLKEKLAAFVKMASAKNKSNLKEPDRIPADATIKLGDSAEEVGILKRRLIFWGDLNENEEKSDFLVYNKSTQNAIADFQARHGILEDGKVGPETISMLNASVESRIGQISLNMERLRWLPEEIGDHYIWVNIPDYQVKIIKNGKEDLKMRVIVGEKMNETPIFSDTMEFIVFSPTWTVPMSISTEEMLPKIKEDDDFFEDRNLLLYESWEKGAEVIDPRKVNWKKVDKENFEYKIVEKPSESNALGLVKFMFPNSEAIYLHDTPTDHLFDETERGFSHGCIRVEKPKELAEYLLQENDEDWDQERITEYMEMDTPTTITMKKRLPVHIVYHSAWVDEENKIHFRKDIYNHDKTQEQAIDKKEEQLM